MSDKSKNITKLTSAPKLERVKKGQVVIGQANFSSEAGLGLPITRVGGSYKGAKYLPYSGNSQRYGSDNTFPNAIAKLFCDSPTNMAAISRKSMMIKGEGFNFNLMSANFKSVMETLNDDGQSANDVLELVGKDYSMFGGFALRVIWGNDGKIKQVYHERFEDVRSGFPNPEGKVEYFIVCNNWARDLTYTLERLEKIPKFDPKHFGEGSVLVENGIPMPNDNQQSNAEQLIYYYDQNPAASDGMRFYPVPDYIAGFDYIQAEISVGIANASLPYNGFGGKTIVKFPFKPTDDKEFAENDADIKQSFQGADKNGGVVTLYGESEERLPTIDSLEALKADAYLELDKNVKQGIVTSHLIPSILLEINQGGGFNNRAEEMTIAYNQFQKTYIKSKQQKVIGVFKNIAKNMGFTNEVIEIIPFSLEDNTNVSSQTTSTITK